MKITSCYIFKKILFSLIIILSLQSFTIADDIQDLEIEGMSVGDSLLNYMSEIDIKKEIEVTKNHYSYLEDPLRFREVYLFSNNNNFNTYKTVSVMFKNNDNKYKIVFIRGMKDYVENLQGCISKRSEISKEIETILPKYSKDHREGKSRLDKSGKSTTNNIYYIFNSGNGIILACNNWEEKLRKKNNWTEGLSVVLRTNEVGSWLNGG